MVPASTAPASQVAGPSSGVKTASKDKGKRCALPGPYNDEVPAGIPSFEDDPYGYSLTYDSGIMSDPGRSWDTVMTELMKVAVTGSSSSSLRLSQTIGSAGSLARTLIPLGASLLGTTRLLKWLCELAHKSQVTTIGDRAGSMCGSM
jgi:hypothetical protein